MSATLADVLAANPACAGIPTHEFYLASYEEIAKATCAGCPAKVLCQDYAIDSGEPHGVWGGLSEAERRVLRRRRGMRPVPKYTDPVISDGEHRCSSCKRYKPRDQFTAHRGRPNGVSAWCRTCVQDRSDHGRRTA